MTTLDQWFDYEIEWMMDKYKHKPIPAKFSPQINKVKKKGEIVGRKQNINILPNSRYVRAKTYPQQPFTKKWANKMDKWLTRNKI